MFVYVRRGPGRIPRTNRCISAADGRDGASAACARRGARGRRSGRWDADGEILEGTTPRRRIGSSPAAAPAVRVVGRAAEGRAQRLPRRRARGGPPSRRRARSQPARDCWGRRPDCPRCVAPPCLSALGQSVWIDFLSRDLIDSGGLARAIGEDAVGGVTSNPSIFEKALSRGHAYNAQKMRPPGRRREALLSRLGNAGCCNDCDLLRPVWERSQARPTLRLDRGRPESRPRHERDYRRGDMLHEAIAEPNLLVKIPATDAESVPSRR